MTTLAVLADPPRPGLVLPRLSPPLDPDGAATLYAASLADTFRAVARSGGDLLVNYRADDDLPSAFRGEESAETAVRSVAHEALDDLADVRFEVQVGSTFAARAGNTVTHLLREEGVDSVAILDGTAPFLTRPAIDAAAMKLRTSEVVLAPASRGHVAYAGFTAPIDFEGAWTPPEVATLADRAIDSELDVDFIERQPVLRTATDLATVVAEVEARRRAGRHHPPATAAAIDQLGLRVGERDDERRVFVD